MVAVEVVAMEVDEVAAAMAGEDMEVVAEVAGTEEVAVATEVCYSRFR